MGDGSGLTGISTVGITDSSGDWRITSFTRDPSSRFTLRTSSGYYTRVGNIVSFSATIALSGSGNNTPSYIEIDLPITSNFQSDSDASGHVSGTNNRYGDNISGYIEATTNNFKLRIYMQGSHGMLDDPTIGLSGMYIVR